MRVLIQRVKCASVTIEQQLFTKICTGLLIFVGIEEQDNSDDIEYLTQKITKIRIFDDQNGVMNLAVGDIGGEILAISQFTLHAATKKGNRPSYIKAANPTIAIPLYEEFIQKLKLYAGSDIKTGVFGADMKVELINDGPVTIWMDSKNRE